MVEIIALIALAIFKDDIDNLSDTLGGIDFLSETTSLIIAIICGFFILQIVSFVLFTVFQNKGMSKISVGFSIAALVFSFLNTGEVYLFFREAAFEVSVAVFVISLIIQAIVCVLVGMCNSTYNSYVCSAGGYAPNQYDQNQYASNQYDQTQYAPNQYAPNQYDQNQYVPNQYAPNQYGANPDMQNIPDSQQQYSNWQ